MTFEVNALTGKAVTTCDCQFHKRLHVRRCADGSSSRFEAPTDWSGLPGA